MRAPILETLGWLRASSMPWMLEAIKVLTNSRLLE
jgi:hypothetical protein